MNLYKSILSAFTALFVMTPAMGAVTVTSVNEAEFIGALSGATWSGDLKGATSNSEEIGISNSGSYSYTDNYEFWKHSSTSFSEETVTAFITIISSASEITMTIGQVDGPFPSGGATGTVTTSYVQSSTLWVGLKSRSDTEVPQFEMFNMTLNGQSIPGGINVTGPGFEGFKIATDNSVNFSGWIRTSQNGAQLPHVGNDAQFKAFGDNSLPAVPEPSIGLLLGLFGFTLIFRRKK